MVPREGNLDPKIANSISYLGAGFLRAIDVADIQARLSALEIQQRQEGYKNRGEQGSTRTASRSSDLKIGCSLRLIETLPEREFDFFTSHGCFLNPLPPLKGSLDGLDRKSLMALWEKDDVETRRAGKSDAALGHYALRALARIDVR